MVYKRPTDLALHTDVPVCCNLLVANVLDEGGSPLCAGSRARAETSQPAACWINPQLQRPPCRPQLPMQGC